MSDFEVRSVDLGRGERLPMLARKSNLIGIFEVAAFALKMRAKGLEVKTIDSAVRAVQLLYDVLSEGQIDLLKRAEDNELLRHSEVETVAERCRIKISAMATVGHGATGMARARLKKGKFAISKVDAVKNRTAKIKLHYIIQFLSGFSDYALLQKIPKDKVEFREASALTLRVLKNSKPVSRNSSDKRGLTREAQKLLFEMTHPDFAGNPWKPVFLRRRNHLILQLLYGLGVRKGELLGVKLADIDFRRGRLFVGKRPDDEDDTRGRQAKCKTVARELPLSDELIQLLLHYVEEVRPLTKRARYHPYLIVARTGSALSLNSIDYLFSSIREAYPEFVTLHAHILRHTVNERLAEMYKGQDEGLVKQIQNYLMGWSKTSNMVQVYTKGYVEEQAKDALLSIQDRMFK
jgi:integrase